ncbi:MAG: hypothetical protein AB7I41_09020 [Candidatus Sericytochromatia bacterium]
MTELDPSKWVEILTNPNLSEAEMETYRTLFDNDKLFQAYVKSMHMQAVLEGFRKIVLSFFQHGFEAETAIIANAYLWMKITQRLYPGFDDEMIQSWMQQSLLLTQLIFQFAIEGYQSALKEDPSISQRMYSTEMEEMYAVWSEHIYSLAQEETISEELLIQRSDLVIQTLSKLLNQYEHEVGLKLDLQDYHKIITHLMLQTFIFTYLNNPSVYYELAVAYEEVYLTLGFDVPSVLIHLKGKEELMHPDKQGQLLALLAQETMNVQNQASSGSN